MKLLGYITQASLESLGENGSIRTVMVRNTPSENCVVPICTDMPFETVRTMPVPIEVIRFLNGEGPLAGKHFGETGGGRGNHQYWWRTWLPKTPPIADDNFYARGSSQVGHAMVLPNLPMPVTRAPKENVDPVSGVAYGLISMHALDPGVVDQLMFGIHARNLTYEAAKANYIADKFAAYNRERASGATDAVNEFDETQYANEFSENYESNEDRIAGVYHGVRYETAWFGGVPHFFILHSPHIKDAAPCSPCAPNAGDLHHAGNVRAFDVPDFWRAR